MWDLLSNEHPHV